MAIADMGLNHCLLSALRERMMKLGILGTGMIVEDLLVIINQLPLEAVSILTTEKSRDKTIQLVEKFELDGYFLDYDQMLASEIDTIYVALPNHLHFAFARKALLHGKHVIIEKPLVLTCEHLAELTQLANEQGVFVLEAMNIHTLPAMHSLRHSLPEIGRVKLISLNYSQYSSRYDAFKNGIIHSAFDGQKGGGALMDINVYNLHFTVGLLGRPVSWHYSANIQNGVDTSGVLLINYPETQVVCIGAKDCRTPTISTLQGEHGTLVLDQPVNQLSGFRLLLNNGESCAISAPFLHRLQPEFLHFIDIIDRHDASRAAAMLEVSTIVMTILESARQQLNIEGVSHE
jgi:predicted dehydrogenase